MRAGLDARQDDKCLFCRDRKKRRAADMCRGAARARKGARACCSLLRARVRSRLSRFTFFGHFAADERRWASIGWPYRLPLVGKARRADSRRRHTPHRRDARLSQGRRHALMMPGGMSDIEPPMRKTYFVREPRWASYFACASMLMPRPRLRLPFRVTSGDIKRRRMTRARISTRRADARLLYFYAACQNRHLLSDFAGADFDIAPTCLLFHADFRYRFRAAGCLLSFRA